MDEVSCWILCKRAWLIGRAACGILRQCLALSSEPRYAVQAWVSALQYPLVIGCFFGKLVASLALMRRGVVPGGPGRPADPRWERLFGKRRLVIQSPDSQLPEKAN